MACNFVYAGLVSFPDPALKEGKGLVHIKRFLGLDDISVRNSSAPIRFMPCGLHVIIMWHRPIAVYSTRVRAVDALPCQNDALSCQSHDMLHPVCPRKRSMCTRSFPSLRAGSGNETNAWYVALVFFRCCDLYRIIGDEQKLIVMQCIGTCFGKFFSHKLFLLL